jgi:hypothetical protein
MAPMRAIASAGMAMKPDFIEIVCPRNGSGHTVSFAISDRKVTRNFVSTSRAIDGALLRLDTAGSSAI